MNSSVEYAGGDHGGPAGPGGQVQAADPGQAILPARRRGGGLQPGQGRILSPQFSEAVGNIPLLRWGDTWLSPIEAFLSFAFLLSITHPRRFSALR